MAVKTRRSKKKISILVEKRPPLTCRLPIELVTMILGFLLIRSSECSHQLSKLRQNLARVSRQWWGVILNSPGYWSKIKLELCSDWYWVTMQLKRSRQHPLDIAIKGRYEDDQSEISDLLDVIIPDTKRLRSLHVDGVSQDVLSLIVRRFDYLEFPCLEDVRLYDVHDNPCFLSPTHSPALRHLVLGQCCSSEVD